MLPIGTAVPSGYLPTDTVTQKAGKFQWGWAKECWWSECDEYERYRHRARTTCYPITCLRVNWSRG
jgi:hypothetical protein